MYLSMLSMWDVLTQVRAVRVEWTWGGVPGGVGARAGIHGNTIVHRFLWFDVFFSTAVDTIVNEMVG